MSIRTGVLAVLNVLTEVIHNTPPLDDASGQSDGIDTLPGLQMKQSSGPDLIHCLTATVSRPLTRAGSMVMLCVSASSPELAGPCGLAALYLAQSDRKSHRRTSVFVLRVCRKASSRSTAQNDATTVPNAPNAISENDVRQVPK